LAVQTAIKKPASQRRPRGKTQHPDGAKTKSATGFSHDESRDIQEQARLRAPMIYEIVRREGEEEMNRPAASLWWSGLAAGLSISFSLLAQAILQVHLPDAPWRPLVTDLGYSVGFVLVVLGRQQLFTENTITVVLPVAAAPSLAALRALGRMWGIVLAANLVGTLLAAVFCSFAPVVTPELRAAMLSISARALAPGPVELFFRAITAGFLIAAMVWLLPSAEGGKFWVITLMTYLIAIGGFAHLIAGSFEAFMLAVGGEIDPMRMLIDFAIPVFLGNVVGGAALFALISYAQVAKET
jgi:formate/nitrite transporter FocA (FNT family)